MKNQTIIFLLILIAFVACKKDEQIPEPISINYFVNTSWESINPLSISLSFDFISETECKITMKLPYLSSSTTTIEKYAFDNFKAKIVIINGPGRAIVYNCVINGGIFSLEGQTEVFTRTK